MPLLEPVSFSDLTSRDRSVEELDRLQAISLDPSVESAVEAVREFLDMDVAYTTTMSPSLQTFETLRGDGESFGVAEGMTIDVEATYCQRVLDGRLPSVIADAKGDPRAASMPITDAADVGAFVSIPLRLSDGSIPGTLCAASHQAKPNLGYRELQFLNVFARLIADQIERQSLEEESRALEEDKRSLQLQAAAAHALVTAVSARDSYTGEHSRDVVKRAGAVGRKLGLGEGLIVDIEQVALLHDIGKIGIPDAILNKPGPLTDEEWTIMRHHPVASEQLIAEIPGLKHLAPALRAEHERWDGGGYPDGLVGEEIPVASRITLACDAYDAMTTDRPYRAALPPSAAREEIRVGAGSQFAPEVAATLLAVLDSEE
jgi:HD-GYP domain-containing protein (c-di-GMP phosphodiesterase class II)